jgi:hypothetical protein
VTDPVARNGDGADLTPQQPALAHLRQVLEAIKPKFELLLRDADTLVSAD